MAVYKCVVCGLLNFAGETECKKCGGQLSERSEGQQQQAPTAPAIYAPNDLVAVGGPSESTYADDYPWVTSEDEKVIESSNKKVQYAAVAALVIAAINLLMWFKASAVRYAVGENTGTEASELLGIIVTQSIITAGIFCVVAFGLWRKSRIAAVAGLIVLVFSVHVWVGALFQVAMPSTKGLFALTMSSSPVVAFAILVIWLATFCIFINGAVGAFKYKKIFGRLV